MNDGESSRGPSTAVKDREGDKYKNHSPLAASKSNIKTPTNSSPRTPQSPTSYYDNSNNNTMEEVIRSLTVTNLTSKRSIIAAYRKEKDLYSQKSIEELESPQIDHIVEKQLLAYGILTSKLSSQCDQRHGYQIVANTLKELGNDYKNLNLTEESLNNAKGHAFTSFIKQDRLLMGQQSIVEFYPSMSSRQTNQQRKQRQVPLHTILYMDGSGRERAIAKYTHEVIHAVNDSMQVIIEGLRDSHREDGHVTRRVSGYYDKVADRLEDIVDAMAIHDYLDSHSKKTR
jgi:N-methylhydantoinase A/oxoprolinase/acetone carboxylase beta subunit